MRPGAFPACGSGPVLSDLSPASSRSCPPALGAEVGWGGQLALKQDPVERGLCCGHPDTRKEERLGLGDWVSECPSAQWRPGPDSACQRTRALPHLSPKICCLLLAIHGGSWLLSSPPCPHLLPLPHPQPLAFLWPRHFVTFQKDQVSGQAGSSQGETSPS